jgi:uncharacterized protein YuzE
MRIEYDKSADAVYIRFTNARIKKTIKVKDGVFADLDKNGNIRGLEVLKFSRLMPKKERHIEIGKKKILLPAFA